MIQIVYRKSAMSRSDDPWFEIQMESDGVAERSWWVNRPEPVVHQLAQLIADDQRSGKLEPKRLGGNPFMKPCRNPRMHARLLFAEHLAR